MVFVVVILVLLVGYLAYRVIRLEKKLNSHTADLSQYHEYMGKRAKELDGQFQSVIGSLKQTAHEEVKKVTNGLLKDYREARQVAEDGAKLVKVDVEKMLADQASDFKVLLDNAYLEQYEKMKRSPPRSKKGPRKKVVEPPSKFRSLDDE